MWRLVSKQWATLQELETHWSIDDVADANDALDAMLEAEFEAHEKKARPK